MMQADVPQISCRFKVGRGLSFDIAGVGRDDASILVHHADGLDADYYLKFGVLHGCVIVTANIDAALKAHHPFDMAFVSPKSGNVYRTWPECEQAL